jgi:hypothetical protein
MNNPLTLPSVLHLRRNHALEHATLQILAKRKPSLSLAGISDLGGFWVFGAVATEELAGAAEEALVELKGGNRGLAVHPYCGTNYLVSGVVAGSAAWLGMIGSGNGLKRKLDRWPVVVALVTVALILTQPLGPLLQARVTTESQMGDLKVTQVLFLPRRDFPIHQVTTRQ